MSIQSSLLSNWLVPLPYYRRTEVDFAGKIDEDRSADSMNDTERDRLAQNLTSDILRAQYQQPIISAQTKVGNAITLLRAIPRLQGNNSNLADVTAKKLAATQAVQAAVLELNQLINKLSPSVDVEREIRTLITNLTNNPNMADRGAASRRVTEMETNFRERVIRKIPEFDFKKASPLDIARELKKLASEKLTDSGYFNKARILFDLADLYIKSVIVSARTVLGNPVSTPAQRATAKAQSRSASQLSSEVDYERAKLYYYFMGNVAQGYALYCGVIANPNSSTTIASKAYLDYDDIGRFMKLFARTGGGVMHEVGRDTKTWESVLSAEAVLNDPKSTEAQKEAARKQIEEAKTKLKRTYDRSEAVFAANINMNRLYPPIFEHIGVVDIGVNATYMDFMQTRREYYDPFITQADIDKNTDSSGHCVLSKALVEEQYIRHLMFDLQDATTAGIGLNHAIPLFNGPFGTLPLELYRALPKVNWGVSYGITGANLTVYKDPKFNGNGFDLTSEPVKHQSQRGTFYISTDTGSAIHDPAEYSKSTFVTPQAFWIRNVEKSQAESVFSYIPGNSLASPGAVWGSTYGVGLRINTPRIPNTDGAGPRDDTARATISIRYQVTNNRAADTEGMWPVSDVHKPIKSLHMGIEWEYGWLIGSDVENSSPDKSPVKITFPFAVRGGFTDLSGATGSVNNWEAGGWYLHGPRAHYISLSAGIKYRGWVLTYEYNVTKNGVPMQSHDGDLYRASSNFLFIGKEF